MGDTFDEGEVDEKPVHEVCVEEFIIGKHEVTMGEFGEFVRDSGYRTDAENGMGCLYWTGKKWQRGKDKDWRDPGFSQTLDHPAVCLNWGDVNEFIAWRSIKDGTVYRLPTEAEWEYAARSGGEKENWAGTNSKSDLAEYAWFGGNSGRKTHPVGKKKPNGLGLYDMSGNVWEWVHDLYADDYYKHCPRGNPKGPSKGSYRVLRGGSWFFPQNYARVANRDRRMQPPPISTVGFRLAASGAGRE